MLAAYEEHTEYLGIDPISGISVLSALKSYDLNWVSKTTTNPRQR